MGVTYQSSLQQQDTTSGPSSALRMACAYQTTACRRYDVARLIDCQQLGLPQCGNEPCCIEAANE